VAADRAYIVRPRYCARPIDHDRRRCRDLVMYTLCPTAEVGRRRFQSARPPIHFLGIQVDVVNNTLASSEAPHLASSVRRPAGLFMRNLAYFAVTQAWPLFEACYRQVLRVCRKRRRTAASFFRASRRTPAERACLKSLRRQCRAPGAAFECGPPPFGLGTGDGSICPIVLKNSKIGSGEETRQIEIRW